MALHTWEDGENIYAEYLNGNIDYLLDTTTTKISALEEELTADITSLEEEIAANTSAISTLEDSISSLTSDISGILANIAPDYSNGITISSGWTATSYGWVNWYSQAGENVTVNLTVNGVEVGRHSHYKYADYYRTQFMVSKGDVIGFSQANGASTAKFFPCKGAS